MHPRFQNFIASLILVLSIFGVSTLFHPGMIFLLEMLAHFGFLILGGLFLVLRLTAFASRERFLYILIGTANLCLGLLAFYLYLTGKVNEGMPQTMTINCILGMILLIDALLLKRKPYEKA